MPPDINLLEEAIKILSSKDKHPDDVEWIGSADGVYKIT